MKITLGPENPPYKEEPKPKCEFCKKPIEDYLLHLIVEKECEIGKFFRRWSLRLFKAIKRFKKELEIKEVDIDAYKRAIKELINNAHEYYPFFQIIDMFLETIKGHNEEGKNLEEFLSLLMKFTSVVYTDTEGLHKIEAFLNGLGEIYRLVIKSHDGEPQYLSTNMEADSKLNDLYFCVECQKRISFDFDSQKTLERIENFKENITEILKIEIPPIDINSQDTLRSYLDLISEEGFLFDFINLLIVRKEKKLDDPINSLKKQDFLIKLNEIINFLNKNLWFRILISYFNSKALLVKFSEFILNNIENFSKLVSDLSKINISEFDIIKALELEDYNSFENLISFLFSVFSAISENNIENVFKNLKFIKNIKNTYICPFCSRIYILVDKKYIILGDGYLEIGNFEGEEIQNCFKETLPHYVVKIYLEEITPKI